MLYVTTEDRVEERRKT